MAYGDGTLSEIIDKRNGKKYWFAKMYVAGKPKTARFEHNKEGKRQAQEWLRTVRRDKEDGLHPTGDTLRQAIEKFIRANDMAELKAGNIKLSSFTRTLSVIKSIPDTLLDMPLSNIRKDDITDSVNKMGQTLSANSINKALSLIRRVLENEVENDRIRKNPTNTIRRKKQESSGIEIYSREEIIRMLKAIRYIQSSGTYHSVSHDYGLLFAMLLVTGVRIGELLGLQWDYIDLTSAMETISIRYTLDSHWYKEAKQKSLILNTPKTTSGSRDIPLLSKRVILPLLSKWVIHKLQAVPPEKRKGFLFSTRDGKPISYQNFFKSWDSIGREAGRECPHCHAIRPNDWNCECGNHVTRRSLKCNKCGRKRPTEWVCPVCNETIKEIHKKPHTTRHTYISYMIARGIPIATVSKVVGHRSPQVTLDVYTHATDKYIEELRSLTPTPVQNLL